MHFFAKRLASFETPYVCVVALTDAIGKASHILEKTDECWQGRAGRTQLEDRESRHFLSIKI